MQFYRSHETNVIVSFLSDICTFGQQHLPQANTQSFSLLTLCTGGYSLTGLVIPKQDRSCKAQKSGFISLCYHLLVIYDNDT